MGFGLTLIQLSARLTLFPKTEKLEKVEIVVKGGLGLGLTLIQTPFPTFNHVPKYSLLVAKSKTGVTVVLFVRVI